MAVQQRHDSRLATFYADNYILMSIVASGIETMLVYDLYCGLDCLDTMSFDVINTEIFNLLIKKPEQVNFPTLGDCLGFHTCYLY